MLVFRRWKELLNDVWHIAVIDFGCASSRILWIKFKFCRVKVCVEVGYGPSEARSGLSIKGPMNLSAYAIFFDG